MEKLFFIVFLLFAISCKENNCVPKAKFDFKNLDESNLDYYKYSNDVLYLDIPSVFTPNGDSINEQFLIITNISDSNFVAADFKIKNSCDKTLYKQNGTFPFVIPDVDQFEDGTYNFDFSIVLLDKKLMTGAGVIMIIRK
jgi:hypothetical protein|tara:strand:- start:885 stop:1304 length:420 start_codon:yes stop_codon:yes gene_type:complete